MTPYTAARVQSESQRDFAASGDAPTAARGALVRLVDPAIVTLLALPLALLVVAPHWPFGSFFRDHWIYYGYFTDLRGHLTEQPHDYYSSRLSVMLPGWLLHELLPAVAAELVLHLGLYWAAVLGFFATAQRVLGRRPALLAAVALGCHPMFLAAVGSNYVDGFGIAYACVALGLLTAAAAGTASRRWLLIAAGACATALVTANLFYALLVPLLAAHFAAVNRQGARLPLLRSALWCAAGAGGLVLAFALLSRAAGGWFAYWQPSFDWIRTFSHSSNPHHDASWAWLLGAVWLIFPVLVLLSGLPLLADRQRAGRGRRLLQLEYTALFTAFFVLQVWGRLAILQWAFYASLLLPWTFLAFAAQLDRMLVGWSRRAYVAVVAAGLVLQAAALLPRVGWEPLAKLVAPWVVQPLALAGVGFGVLLAGAVGPRAVLLVLVSLAASQWLVNELSGWSATFGRYTRQASAVVAQLDRATLTLRALDRDRALRLWYDLGERDGAVYDALVSTYNYCPRLVNHEFPKLETTRTCDGSELAPGMRIAVVSSRADVPGRGVAALARAGFQARLRQRRLVPGPVPGFAVTVFHLEGRR